MSELRLFGNHIPTIEGAARGRHAGAALLVAAIPEGRIDETVCAAQARAAAEGASDPGLRRLLLEVQAGARCSVPSTGRRPRDRAG